MLPTRNYSATDRAITQRPTSTALFVVDSEDRFKNYTEARSGFDATGRPLNNPYSFTINAGSSLMNGFFTRLAITEVVFPWIVPNINLKTNKIIFRYKIGAAPQVDTQITLATGFYTPADLASEIQSAVRTSTPLVNFEMIYGQYAQPTSQPYPGFLYDAVDAGTTCAFIPMTPLSSAWPYANTSRQLFDVLGFTSLNSVLLGATVGGATYCQSCRYVDIVCPQLAYNQALKDTGSQVIMRDSLCRIYITPDEIQALTSPQSATFAPPGCYPTTIYRQFSTPKQIQWLPNQPIVGELAFEVYDDEGDPLADIADLNSTPGVVGYLPFVNRTNWSMTMLVTEN